jgi:hypothetical protein
MAYRACIDRAHPGCLIFLIDQSAFMADHLGGAEGKNKAQGVAEAINRLLQTVVLRCTTGAGLRDYFDIGLIGYSTAPDGSSLVGPIWGGPLAGRDLVPINEVAISPKEVTEITKPENDDAGGVITKKVKVPVWFEPVARGGAPLCQALQYCQQLAADWVARHPDSFPPMVLHVAGGEATDGDPQPEAGRLTELATQDGEVLLFNWLVSNRSGSPITFPARNAALPDDDYLWRLFWMSSEIPASMLQEARDEGFVVAEGSRGVAFNAELVDLVRFLNVGTRKSSYAVPITRENPGCVLFLIDQSGAMADPYGGQAGQSKALALAEAINRFLMELVLRCVMDGVRDYFEVGVIGYRESRTGGQKVGPAFLGELAGRPLVPLSDLANHPVRVEERTWRDYDADGKLLIRSRQFPVWFDPVAEGGTPMGEAFRQAHQILAEWVRRRPESFPPMVIHFTSGEATDGDPRPEAARLKSLGTDDGAVLLFTCHLASPAGGPVVFPGHDRDLPDETARLLFGMSSELPPAMQQEAQSQGLAGEASAKGFAWNGDLLDLIRFFGLG